MKTADYFLERSKFVFRDHIAEFISDKDRVTELLSDIGAELHSAYAAYAAGVMDISAVEGPPVPMIMSCPECGTRHIDKGEFATKPHNVHACQHCGMVWMPTRVNTVGVQFLPGFKDE